LAGMKTINLVSIVISMDLGPRTAQREAALIAALSGTAEVHYAANYLQM